MRLAASAVDQGECEGGYPATSSGQRRYVPSRAENPPPVVISHASPLRSIGGPPCGPARQDAGGETRRHGRLVRPESTDVAFRVDGSAPRNARHQLLGRLLRAVPTLRPRSSCGAPQSVPVGLGESRTALTSPVAGSYSKYSVSRGFGARRATARSAAALRYDSQVLTSERIYHTRASLDLTSRIRPRPTLAVTHPDQRPTGGSEYAPGRITDPAGERLRILFLNLLLSGHRLTPYEQVRLGLRAWCSRRCRSDAPLDTVDQFVRLKPQRVRHFENRRQGGRTLRAHRLINQAGGSIGYGERHTPETPAPRLCLFDDRSPKDRRHVSLVHAPNLRDRKPPRNPLDRERCIP